MLFRSLSQHSQFQNSEVPDPDLSEAESPPAAQAARIILGTDAFGDTDVEWQVTSKANPHLMVVGLPGMGKTEALLNICQ